MVRDLFRPVKSNGRLDDSEQDGEQTLEISGRDRIMKNQIYLQRPTLIFSASDLSNL